MKKNFNNKIRMFWTVLAVLLEYEIVWKTLSVFQEIYDEFNAFLKDIESTAIVAGVTTEGATIEKNTVKGELAVEVFRICSALSTFAVRTNNPKLKAKVNFSETKLKRMAQPKLLSKAREVKALMEENMTAIAGYGIKPADHDLLVIQIDKYAAEIPAPKVTSGERKAANEKLKALFSDTTKLQDQQMDKLMEYFRKVNPDFYNAYWHARDIVAFGTRHEKKPEVPKVPEKAKE